MISSALCGAIFLLSTASVFHKPHLEPYHSERIVSFILNAHKVNSLVLVSGSVRLEGAVIATFAQQDRSSSHYVVRGTAVLASGNFMATTYAERFHTPDAIAKWIKDNQIDWIIVQESKEADSFYHNQTLMAAINSNILGANLALSLPKSKDAGGKLLLYTTPAIDTMPSRSDEIFSELQPSSLQQP